MDWCDIFRRLENWPAAAAVAPIRQIKGGLFCKLKRRFSPPCTSRWAGQPAGLQQLHASGHRHVVYKRWGHHTAGPPEARPRPPPPVAGAWYDGKWIAISMRHQRCEDLRVSASLGPTPSPPYPANANYHAACALPAMIGRSCRRCRQSDASSTTATQAGAGAHAGPLHCCP